MSENNTNQNRNRRSRGGRNRNRSGQQRNNNNNQNRQQNNRGGSNRPPRHRRPPKKLTFWEKILKALGLYKDPNAKPAAKGKSGSGQANRSGGPVNQVQGKKQNKSGGKKGKSGGERKSNVPTVVETARLYVGNLSYDASEYELEELFKGVGAVRSVELVYNRRTHKSKGYGFISMGSVDEAKRAVEVLHDQPFMGRRLIVNGARSNGPADGDSEGRPRRESKNYTKNDEGSAAPAAETPVPENEEVHSLAQND